MLTLFSIGCYSPIVLLFFAAGVVFAVRASKEIRLMSDLDKQGRLTIGHIVRHRVYTLVSVPSSGPEKDMAPAAPRGKVYRPNPKRLSAKALGTTYG